MNRGIILFGVLSIVVFAASGPRDSKAAWSDRDMDGVIDRYDRCPNTPFFALVNKNGCTVKQLKVSKKRKREIQRLLSSQR